MEEDFEFQINYYEKYYSIAKRHLLQIDDNIKRSDQITLKTKEDEHKQAELNHKIERDAIVTIIFCALTLEAFINSIAIANTSKSYFDSYLDKLNPISKFVVIPKLFTGREIDRKGKAFELLKETFKKRDKLVHFKSRTWKTSDLISVEIIDEYNAKRAVQSVELILGEMKKFLPKMDFDWLQDIGSDPFA